MPPVQEKKQSSDVAFLETGIQEEPSTWKVISAVFAAGWFSYSIYSTATGLWRWIGSKLEERNKRLAEQTAEQMEQAELVQRVQQAQNIQAQRRGRRAWSKNM
jgi:hypothetical protein